MGIDVMTFRLRVGMHAARVAHGSSNQGVLASPQTQLCSRIGLNFLLIVSLTTACLSCAYLAGLSVYSRLLTSQCVSSLGQAITGGDVLAALIDTKILPRCTLDGYDRDLSPLLLLSGSVETNPGPTMEELLDERLKGLREDIRKDLKEEIRDCLVAQLTPIYKRLDELVESMKDVNEEVSKVKSKLEEQDDLIFDLQTTCEDTRQQLTSAEKHIEDLEREKRRNNILLHGIPEEDKETVEDCEKKVLETVNAVLPGLMIDGSLASIHRVGRKVAGKNRPMLVQVLQMMDKLAIVRAREDFKKKKIGVSNDMTPQQRTMIAQARNEGKIGFFKGGNFYTKPMHHEEATTSGQQPPPAASNQGLRRSRRHQSQTR